jgi:hypothetical protein
MTSAVLEKWFEGVVHTAYGDESADEKKQRVYAVGGLFGDKSDWEAFEENWKRHMGGLVFHASDCETGKGDFAQFDREQNLKLYADLTKLIAASRLIGSTVSIDIPAYRELIGPLIDQEPYYLCFHSVVLHLAIRSGACIPQDRIKFKFDSNLEIIHNASSLYQYIINDKANKFGYRKLMEDELGFTNRNDIGIQAADLIAREGMKLLDNRHSSRPTRLSTQTLQACKRVQFRVFDRGWCEGFVRRSKDHQYDTTGYFEWLKENGLTPSLSHKIVYEATLPDPLPSSLPSVSEGPSATS